MSGKNQGEVFSRSYYLDCGCTGYFSMIRVMKGIREGEVYMKYSFESVKYEKNLPAKF